MFISKKHLSRRTVLRGVGVAIGLPLLDAMIPAHTALAKTAAKGSPRMGFFYLPHGAVMTEWTPKSEGTQFELSRILQPLEPFRRQLTVVSGLANKPADSNATHAITPATWLSAVPPEKSNAPIGGVTDRSDGGPAHRTGNAAAVHRGGGDGTRRKRGMQRHVWLRPREHHFISHADDASADGSGSPQALQQAIRGGR